MLAFSVPPAKVLSALWTTPAGLTIADDKLNDIGTVPCLLSSTVLLSHESSLDKSAQHTLKWEHALSII